MKYAILISALLLSGCGEPPGHAKRIEKMWESWDACIETGGIPIQDSWLGAPAMARCERKKCETPGR